MRQEDREVRELTLSFERFSLRLTVAVIPNSDGVEVTAAPSAPASALSLQTAETQPAPVFYTGEVLLASNRGRDLGTGDCLLVDLPWDYVGGFAKATSLRGEALKKTTLVQFRKEAVVGFPNASSALALAEQWLGDGLDPDTVEEYATGNEGGNGVDLLGSDGPEVPPDIAGMQEQIRNLEAQLRQREEAARADPLPNGPAVRGQEPAQNVSLFAGQQQGLAPSELARLQRLAGPAPSRPRGALQQGAHPPRHQADGLLAEVEKEALDSSMMLEGGLMENLEHITDPVQKIMMMQLQQNSILIQRPP
eukprot:Skav210026  [mRNA]  locus=scaffold1212:309298:310218:+ [translate_table: standard]